MKSIIALVCLCGIIITFIYSIVGYFSPLTIFIPIIIGQMFTRT